MNKLPPLMLERRLDSRIWGGDRLGAWLGLSDAPAQLAESWQVYAANRVADGPLAGRTLAELVQEHGADLVGTRSWNRNGADFPLLAKFIDAADDLSVQVHPPDEYAHRVEAATGFHGKTEAWYILDAAPGTRVVHGFDTPTSRDAFAAAVADGSLMQQVRHVPIQPGDSVFVPAGTVHAILAGTLLFEIQQTSDLTYRVYDYDRRDKNGQLRELHLDRALDVIDYAATPPAIVPPQPIGPGRERLVACPYFVTERSQIDQPTEERTDPGSFEIVTVIDGALALDAVGETRHLPRGTSIVLPASLGPYTLRPAGNAVVLRNYVP